MMPLCGVTKQRNSLICCNILAETSVKTHFHKSSVQLDLLKAEQDFFSEKGSREVSVHHHLFPCSALFLFAPRTKVLPAFVQQTPAHMTVHFLHDLPKVDTIL